MHEDRILRDTQIVIDLSRIAKNVKLIKDMIGPDVALMAVVKANAYGLGALPIAPTIIENGAEYLAVATLSEAVHLKEAYPQYPVFILGHTPIRYMDVVAEYGITQTVFSYEQAKALSDSSVKFCKTSRIHIKVDTGFHRLGKEPSAEYADEIIRMSSLPSIVIEGIFSHLALAGDENDRKQYKELCDFIALLESRGCTFRYKHIADSIACVDYPEFRMNMVRPGALIYGMIGCHKGSLPVEQAVSFKSAVSQIHRISKGEGVGYDFLWTAERDSAVATMPFGYADGYPRRMRDKGYVIINGKKAPIIGVLCMDQVIADVTDIPDAEEGSSAVIYGDGTDGSMTIAEAAGLLGTNKNDILCRLTSRPPRIYTGGK